MTIYDAGGLPAEAAGLLVSDREGGALRFAALALPLPGAPRVGVWLEIDGASLLAGHEDTLPLGGSRGEDVNLHLEIYLYALNASGGIGGSLIKVVEVAFPRRGTTEGLPEGSRELGADGVAFRGELALSGPGDYRLRLLLRNRQTGAVGLRSIPVAVVGTAADAPQLLPPLAARPDDTTWRMADAVGGPPVFGFHPAALPLAARGDKVPLELHLGGLSVAVSPVLEVLGANDEVVAEEAVRFVPGEGLAKGWRRARATFATRGLPAGTYLLRLRVANPPLTSAVLPVVIAPGSTVPSSWATLEAGTGPAAAKNPRAPPVLRPEVKLALPDDQVADSFLQALRFLVDGEDATAGTLLHQTEAAALDGSAVAIATLVRLELEASRRLAAHDPECLVPILDLYLGLYRLHHRERRFLLASHSRRLTAEILDLYQRDSTSQQSQAIAADFLAQLAEVSRSLTDLRRALELNPEQPEVLRAVATVVEQRGHYRVAASHLERLVAIEPDNEEARLRLAVNLGRLGKVDRAREIHRRLADTATQPWIVSVAWQELVRLALRGEHFDEAENLVGRGLERLPDDEKLLFLKALVLDLRRRPKEATAFLEARMPLGVRDQGSSPRQIYSSPTTDALPDTRRRWQEAVRPRLAVLASAVHAGSQGP